MKIAICDDDPIFIEELCFMLKEFFQNSEQPKITTYDRGEVLISGARLFDIIFLDVEMPGISGIETGKKLKTINPDVLIIMTTSYMEYLDDAMSFSVFRYLSKPLDKDRLFRNLHEALQVLFEIKETMLIETKEKNYTVPVSKIVCVEAIDRKILVYILNGPILESTRKLDFWRKVLGKAPFFETHRSFIINMAYVNEFDHNTVLLRAGDDEKNMVTAYLTRRRYTAFKKEFLLYLGEQHSGVC